MRWRIGVFALISGLACASLSGAPEIAKPVPDNYLAQWLMSWPTALGIGDLKANYPGHFYKVDPSIEMVIEGEYPHCRYFSFVAHDMKNRTIATLHDSDIAPDQGSVNPFLPGADWNAPNRRYTLIIRFTAPPAGTGPAVMRGPQTARGNILYAGLQADGTPNQAGLLVYRRYLPSQGYDVNGGVPMPKIYYRKVSDQSLVKPISKTEQGILFLRAMRYVLRRTGESKQWADKAHKAGSASSKGQPLQWRRSPVVGAENPDTVYLFARVNPDPDKLLLMRWKAPTFPDTWHGHGLTGKEEVRYWSMCFAPKSTMTKFTLADAEAVINPDGFVNLVVGFGAERPAKVTPENGYTWVDLKGMNIRFILYRNMVVSPEFKYVARDVPAGEPVTDQIGDYLPRTQWLSPENF